jgi:prevent-host-death family protein
MKSYTMAKVQAHFAELVERVSRDGEPARITRGRKVVAALVAPEDYELLRRIRAEEDAEDIREAKKTLAE